MLFSEVYNWILIYTDFERRRKPTTQQYANENTATVSGAFCFGAEARKDEARLWISKPVTWMWNQNTKGKFYSLDESVHICVPAFFVAQNVGYNWMGYVFSGKYRQDKSVPREMKRRLRWGAGTAFRQNGKNSYGKDIRDVVYRNKQGNCIDSFRRNLRNTQISL